MKASGKILLVIIAAYFLHSIAIGQTIISGQDTSKRIITTAVPFLTIAPDARSGGLGESGVASSSSTAPIHWNIAGLSFTDARYGASYSHTPWLGKIINDMSLTYLTVHYKINSNHTLASSVRYFNLGDIFVGPHSSQSTAFKPREYAIDIGYSPKLSKSFALGMAVRYIRSNLTGNFSSSTIESRPGYSIAADISGYWEKDLICGSNSKLALGASITNIGTKLSYSDEDNKDFIPTNLRLGTTFRTNLASFSTLTIGFDFNKLMVPTPPVHEIDPDTGALVVDPDGNPIIAGGKNPNRSLLNGILGSFADAPDGINEELKEVSVNAGLELLYKERFALRTGYFYEHESKGNRKFMTLGTGYKGKILGIDLSYLIPQEINHPLSETFRVSVKLFIT
jgi:hypothetical protein